MTYETTYYVQYEVIKRYIGRITAPLRKLQLQIDYLENKIECDITELKQVKWYPMEFLKKILFVSACYIYF